MKYQTLMMVGLLHTLVLAQFVHAETKAHRGDVRDVRVLRKVEQHPEAWRVWQPYIIQGERPRQLIVAYGAMTNGKKDMGDIVAVVSNNDGDTWSEPVYIFNHQVKQGMIQFAYANPVLYRVPGQKVVWCFAMRCSIQQENSEESGLVAAYTADGGRTWVPVELAMHYTGPLITNDGIIETMIGGQRHYLLPAHRNTLAADPRGSRDHFILSSTSLLEWKLEAYIPQPETARVFLHEGNLTQGDRPDELKIVMRTADYDNTALTTQPPRAYLSVSRDGGRTWSVAAEEPELHNSKAKGFFRRLANGGHIYVYNDGPAQRDIAPGFPYGGRTSLKFKVKPAGGAWGEERVFYDAGIKNSYPTLIEVSSGEFRAVWDSGTERTPRTHISFGKFSLKPSP